MMSWDFYLIPDEGKFAEAALEEIRAMLEAIPHIKFAESLYGVFVDAETRDLIAEGIRQGIHGGNRYIPRAAFVTLEADRLILEKMGDVSDEVLAEITVWCQQRWRSVLVTTTDEKVTADIFRSPRRAG
jgi:hypothetical protein